MPDTLILNLDDIVEQEQYVYSFLAQAYVKNCERIKANKLPLLLISQQSVEAIHAKVASLDGIPVTRSANTIKTIGDMPLIVSDNLKSALFNAIEELKMLSLEKAAPDAMHVAMSTRLDIIYVAKKDEQVVKEIEADTNRSYSFQSRLVAHFFDTNTSVQIKIEPQMEAQADRKVQTYPHLLAQRGLFADPSTATTKKVFAYSSYHWAIRKLAELTSVSSPPFLR